MTRLSPQLTTETLDSSFYDSHELQRTYDTLGRPIGYTLQDSASTALSSANYSYSTTGRLSTVSDGSDTFTYGYESDSNLLASVTAPQHTVAYSYETNRDLMAIIDNQASGASLSKYTYSYDLLGRRTDRAQSGSAINTAGTDAFSYNGRSEVIGSSNSVETGTDWNPTYSYDKIGNRQTASGSVAASYTANALNQYTAISATSPVYDLDGNLTSDGGNWTYTWNNENRLASATDGTTTIDFTYDYQGRLVKKDDGTDIEIYIYDGWNCILTFDVQGSTFNVQSSFLWGLDLSGTLQGAGGVGGLLKESEYASNSQLLTSYYSLYDANGNIMQKLDSSGTVAMSVDYDPFGNVIAGTLVGEYGFSTKPLVESLDWYYYGFRYYDPVTGRWPNRDPIEEFGGINLYGMVGNSSINLVDILGYSPYGTGHTTLSGFSYSEQSNQRPHSDNRPDNLGTYYNDPYSHCLSEGWFRHCVNSCILQNLTGIGALTQAIAQASGGDLPWQETRDDGDVAANQQGIENANRDGVEQSCLESCRQDFEQEVKAKCCDSDKTLKKNDPDCCPED